MTATQATARCAAGASNRAEGGSRECTANGLGPIHTMPAVSSRVSASRVAKDATKRAELEQQCSGCPSKHGQIRLVRSILRGCECLQGLQRSINLAEACSYLGGDNVPGGMAAISVVCFCGCCCPFDGEIRNLSPMRAAPRRRPGGPSRAESTIGTPGGARRVTIAKRTNPGPQGGAIAALRPEGAAPRRSRMADRGAGGNAWPAGGPIGAPLQASGRCW